MDWSWTADEAGFRAASTITQGPVLEEALDDDDDDDEEEEEKKEEKEEEEEEEKKEEEKEVPGGSDWSQKPGLGGSLIWMGSRIHQSTDDDF